MLGTKVTARRSKRARQNRGDVKESLGNLPHEGCTVGETGCVAEEEEVSRRQEQEQMREMGQARSVCIRHGKRKTVEFQAAMEGGPLDESQVRELNGKTKQQTAWKRGENHDCRRDSGSVKGAPRNRGRLRSSQSGDVSRSLKAREVVGGVRDQGRNRAELNRAVTP